MSYNHDKVVAGLISEKDLSKIREAVCIQVEKIYDSCKEKDCIENAKVLFKNPESMQRIINRAINVKCKRSVVLDVFTDVEEVPFKRGFFTVDVKFFIKVSLDFFVPKMTGGTRAIPRQGIVVFSKKVVLFGSEGNVKIFKSHYVEPYSPAASSLQQDNQPIAKVEVAEPICLNAKIEDVLDKLFDDCSCIDQVPGRILEAIEDEEDVEFDSDERGTDEARHEGHIPSRRVVVTIGLFSIIKLARLVQLLIPAFDFCVPNKECIASTDENPCELFETIEFPVDEFFPPQKFDFPGALEEEEEMVQGMEEHHKHGRQE
ncbi:MAG: hypothetical protein QHH06_14565 [Clostridiales bacterium]|jgi:hypothetical protein|nr:hypothetical protein [Eubacteriales bacterium]MDH7567665.1 hypothetical protein [Clostridiales bacterium]